jgi:zinc/manganese transport system substrate-binding protein
MRLPGSRVLAPVGIMAISACALTACGSADSVAASSGGKINVVAAENCWGSIAAQLGGGKANVTSIITNPDADPHDYEPTPSDARTLAAAKVVIINGVGYDSWATKLQQANGTSGQDVLTVGKLVHQPDDGNPHRWYDPSDVKTVMAQITADYKQADPKDGAYFDHQLTTVESQNFQPYFAELAAIKAKYANVPIGASESIVAPLASYLGLDLVTPASFLRAISEGTDPSAKDKATIDQQIATRAIKVYVYNTQNATPDVQAQVNAAKSKGIPIVPVTETLSPREDTFEQWQLTQLQGLAAALSQATGR